MKIKAQKILSRYKNDRLVRLGYFTVGISDTFGYALFKKQEGAADKKISPIFYNRYEYIKWVIDNYKSLTTKLK